MSSGPLALDSQLCFLFHRISRALTTAYRPLLVELDLTYPQYLVMLVLWERDGVGVGEIGERLRLDSGTLSPLLRRMETAGLLERNRTTSDERRVTIQLTEVGRDLRKGATGVPTSIAGHLFDDVADYIRLHAELQSLAGRLESHQAERAMPPASDAP